VNKTPDIATFMYDFADKIFDLAKQNSTQYLQKLLYKLYDQMVEIVDSLDIEFMAFKKWQKNAHQVINMPTDEQKFVYPQTGPSNKNEHLNVKNRDRIRTRSVYGFLRIRWS
jgi:hypothetical protein